MLESFLFTVEAVVPVFILVFAGYFMKRIGFISDAFVSCCNKFIFNVALPCLLFKNVGECGFQEAFNPKIMLFSVVSICSLCFFLMWLVPRFEKDLKKCGASVQAMFRSNFILLGLPLVINISGEENAGSAAALIAVAIISFNFLATVCLEYFSNRQKQVAQRGRAGLSPQTDVQEERARKRRNLGRLLLSILKNPLIIASVVGILYSLSGWELPNLIQKPIYDVAGIATPLALITIGGQFNFQSAKNNRLCIAVATFVKLVAVPLVFVTLSVLLGFRGADLAGLFVFFAAPTAVSSYIMAQDMNSDGELAGQLVIFTTLFSALSIFLGVFILRSLQLVGG